jgi:hypothetical protein
MNTPHLVQGVNYPHPMGGDRKGPRAEAQESDRQEHPPFFKEHPPFHAENTPHPVGGHQAVHQASNTIPLVLARPHRFAAWASELPITSDAERGQ